MRGNSGGTGGDGGDGMNRDDQAGFARAWKIDPFSSAIWFPDWKELEGELGDLLFTVVNLARVVNVDPELALRATSRRFVDRVELAERLAGEAGESWAELGLDAQEAWYVRAKEQLAADLDR